MDFLTAAQIPDSDKYNPLLFGGKLPAMFEALISPTDFDLGCRPQ